MLSIREDYAIFQYISAFKSCIIIISFQICITIDYYWYNVTSPFEGMHKHTKGPILIIITAICIEHYFKLLLLDQCMHSLTVGYSTVCDVQLQQQRNKKPEITNCAQDHSAEEKLFQPVQTMHWSSPLDYHPHHCYLW